MSDDDDDGNPFKLPTDDQWYFFQEQEVLKKQAEIEKVKHQKVHEKTTSSQRIGASRGIYQVLPQLRPSYSATSLPRSESPSGAVGDGGAAKPPALTDKPPASADDAKTRRRRRSKEPPSGSSGPLADDRGATQHYVAKKHELFFVQMNLDAKKEEIQRLDQRASRREEAVKRSMKQLEEDHQRMQAFIDSNSVRASNVLQAAQEMTQKKNNKLATKRQLKASLVVLQSEIAKLREHKDECVKLKAFLESVTPQEWIDARLEEKKERKRNRREAWVERQFQESEARMMAEISAEVKAMEERNAEAARSRRRRPRREMEEEQREREKDMEVRKKRIQKKYPGREKFEADYMQEHGDESSGEDLPLYFKEPRQLLDVFTSMEEANLFLIQNSQNTEQTLEEFQQKNEEAKRNNAVAREKMDQQLEILEKQIEEEKEKSQYFKMKIKEQDTTSAQEALEQYLCDRASEVYTACGYEAERDPDTLKMLAATEAKLEEYLGVIEEAETTGYGELVEQLERDKESARRAMVKQMRKEIQDRKTKERTQAALLRSQAPIHKRTRRQIMFRSPPGYTAQRVVVEDDGYEEAVREHTVFGVWTGKDGAANTAAPRKPAT
mmetsp:Transcript_43339/g.92792  ORF Transcript_43339/g.92792 Transcript_43339/m.92792 type:complete len:610 (-) Transcript_43339:88-1917(-)|eukprot:CAMPEP_0206600672 /NCGR_PEP_ID=MMETSP0325_2-20121206/45988_1 /ASSEMBLY_ACC=CAM_ASM_000347 /TAXON_ID=2866 /ORGANISM="Crypthecodinium cohnii, Strain Seligo" /LENGTH=609 /DNA_ID=CAMNT_0054112127 /DNA_START=15 /DNA_END=1844 /DNA_ORIENTATION=-